ncbi:MULTISPECIES: tRNA (adenosine(37)-N6)-dimethylallyltransferase MiaA [Bartonella]|uniref:tRNA (adenosine(37)-N6)-dimethylallyltransferase MiaA n=1 Tax=Bartonella TaxID=773 RepID=UPI0018DD95CF|nr:MULTISPECIES: tRNA (adenosine(37)-N6)-dimethylallyltransferase MiaA [Bartonella]MBH9994554.1 tRNA (adenosine(37)-N6)-dimethylallyltransferase MiaA [Bartonella sp. P0291]MBH9997101.1 tRNA (adenosine(37)-N6)-dimethylallyltransferase MiaA [Bartonella sp. M0192]MBH9999261.1 tRNA (adenosine(37)-N6)-dimethylallyltransferase MiaA [Bartonella sp. M0191]MBI0007258.1 tRNA (adenosine(37)-N6)-dimethylallyltransferase MiaA [Bartonella sp. M0193]MBI0010552.1 tRNA (adenosine(37)-N6)-dimethylallyltransfera
MKKRTITLIAGPTASGKSDFALKLAEKSGASIVNADSMQVYSVLQIITARPDNDDMMRVPHYLYGYVSPEKPYSTGQWLKDASDIIKSVEGPLIFVGGTGLYFKTLLEGMAEIPDIPANIREKWREELKKKGASALYNILKDIDGPVARRLSDHDGQRIIRALEVYEATGKPLGYWQSQKTKPVLEGEDVTKLLLMPDRNLVYRRIEDRFDKMVDNGALDEVRSLIKLGLDPSMPAMKAIGVPEFNRVLRDEDSIETAIVKAKTGTRRYAKRQMTWFRHQLASDWKRI